MESKRPNETVTGRLFAKYAQADGGDFEWFVRCRRQSGKWSEAELALSVKDRLHLADVRIEDVRRDMQEVA